MNASPETRARWWFAGCLLLVALAAGAWLLPNPLRYSTYEIRSADPVSGLIAGAPVEFHGVEVGRVKRVQLLKPRLVSVLLEVERDVPLSAATVATITGRGLAARGFTGYVYVSLDDSGASGAPLARAPDSPYPQVASGPARQVSLDTSIQQINDSVQSVNTLLRTALDAQTLASMKQSLASLERVTHTLAANSERMAQILANAERASGQLQGQVLPRVQDTIVRLDRLTGTVDQRMGSILGNTERASARLEPLLQSSEEAMRTLQTQLLPETQRTVMRLDQLSTSLGETAGRVQRNPSLLVRGVAAAPGPGEGP
jgi:phospholipid/cholesterol/gamma-HCH transport system substrate-binding protein